MPVYENRKQYKNVVDHVQQEIISGSLLPGDKLPTERELAEQLSISRNSIREGLRVLENIGIVQSTQGSGNYISQNFDETMADTLSFLYYVKGMDEKQVTEFRWMIEREALELASFRISEKECQTLQELLCQLDEAPDEEERIQYDKQIHTLIVQASGNPFLIANYEALMGFMDRYIQTMRRRIIEGMTSRNQLEQAHHELVEGLLEHDLSKSRKGLEAHFGYVRTYQNF